MKDSVSHSVVHLSSVVFGQKFGFLGPSPGSCLRASWDRIMSLCDTAHPGTLTRQDPMTRGPRTALWTEHGLGYGA